MVDRGRGRCITVKTQAHVDFVNSITGTSSASCGAELNCLSPLETGSRDVVAALDLVENLRKYLKADFDDRVQRMSNGMPALPVYWPGREIG
jgi:hypothetical protein